MTVQSVMTGAKPYQNDLLLPFAFHSLSTTRNAFNKSSFITKLSQFLFSPYRSWFSSLKLLPLTLGSEKLKGYFHPAGSLSGSASHTGQNLTEWN